MGAGAWALHRFVTRGWHEFAALLVPIAAAVLLFALVARLLGMKELGEISARGRTSQ